MVVNNRWLLKMAVQNNVCVCENSCKRIENDCCCLFDAILCIQILLLFSKCIDRIYASPWKFRIWFLFIPEYIFFPSINRECLKKEKKRMKVSAWNASLKWCGVCVCVFSFHDAILNRCSAGSESRGTENIYIHVRKSRRIGSENDFIHFTRYANISCLVLEN